MSVVAGSDLNPQMKIGHWRSGDNERRSGENARKSKTLAVKKNGQTSTRNDLVRHDVIDSVIDRGWLHKTD